MATGSKKIFVGSSLFLAFIDRVNLNHTRAVEIFDFLARQKYQVYTSDIVVTQTFSDIDRGLGSSLSKDFLQAILESNIQILYISESDLLSAFRFMKTGGSHKSSLLELLNANLMQKNAIGSILTFDSWPNTMGTVVSSLITTS